MTLRHFEPVMTTTAPSRTATIITDQVRVVTRPSESRAFVAKEQTAWDWSDLRDYVVTQIEKRFGAFPRDFRKESGIFKAFLARHGEAAPAIARYAFEVEDGFWAGAPISITRFCKNSDAFFSEPIAARLIAAPVVGW